MSTISIIVPVYNCEDYLSKCVESVLAQTFTDYTLILVDDGSADNSGKICDDYASKYDNIIAFHKENGGAASARNLGIDYVIEQNLSDYIGFIDSDDFVHPQMYEILYDLIKKSGSDMSTVFYQFAKPLEEIDFYKYNQSEYSEFELLSCRELLLKFNEIHRMVSLISPCMKLYKTQLFDGLRFIEGYIEEDSVLLPRLLERANNLARIKLPLYVWTVREGSVTRSGFNKNSLSFIRVSYENALFFEQIGIKSQKRFYKKQFMNRCVKVCCMLQEHYELKKYFIEYRKLYNKKFLSFLFDSGFCISEYFMHILFLFHIPLSMDIYKRLNPDFDSVF